MFRCPNTWVENLGTLVRAYATWNIHLRHIKHVFLQSRVRTPLVGGKCVCERTGVSGSILFHKQTAIPSMRHDKTTPMTSVHQANVGIRF